MGRSKRSFDFLMMLWPLGKVQSWAAQQPVLGRFIHADVSPDHNRHIIIPSTGWLAARKASYCLSMCWKRWWRVPAGMSY